MPAKYDVQALAHARRGCSLTAAALSGRRLPQSAQSAAQPPL